MEREDYHAAWYQCMLPLAWGGFDTAADVVARSFDFGKLRPIEIAYTAASSALARLKGRVEDFTARYGWELASGVRVMCPLQLEMLVSTLPEGEPIEPAAGAGGAPPTPFAALIRAFLFAPFYEVEDNSAAIWRGLANNPAWLQRCGFPNNQLSTERTLQRFNEVMSWAGLWGDARRLLVLSSYDDGILAPPTRLAIDPGHEDGYAGVRRACAACRSCGACDMAERVPTCDVTDIVAKRKTYQFPGVKGVFVTDVDAEMPIMALAVNARTFDGNVGAVTARAVAAEYPTFIATVKEALLDGAYDIRAEKVAIAEALGGADVLTPINPRNRRPIPIKASRGIDHIDTHGVPHCVQGLPMLYRGKDEARRQFRYGCPLFDRKTGTVTCPNQGRCCPNPGTTGRQYRVDRALTPQVDWDNPQHSEDTKERYKGRTAVERTIARTKRSLPFERHWGRGRRAFQGHLDKGVLAFHVFLQAAHAEGLAKHGRKILTWHKRPDDEDNAVAA